MSHPKRAALQAFLDDTGARLHFYRTPVMEESTTPRPFMISKSGLPHFGHRA